MKKKSIIKPSSFITHKKIKSSNAANKTTKPLKKVSVVVKNDQKNETVRINEIL